MRRTLLTFPLCLLAACVSLDDDEQPRRPGLAMTDLGAMTHVAVLGDVWLGGHATRDDLDIARRRGIEVVVDLGNPPADGSPSPVELLCTELGLRYVSVPVDADDPDVRQVERALEELADAQREALLLLCDDGARCATVFAVHRVVQDQLEFDDAIEEARRVGLKPDTGELAVRRLLDSMR